MAIAVLQTLAAIGASLILFRLWRASRPEQLWLRRMVAAGFLTRAIAGQVLFWISWAGLPFLAELQAGNGVWFFGLDALGYFANATAASSQGVVAVAGMSPSQPAVVYAQLLAVATLLFGAVTSTGLLVNLFCYLGCVALLRRWTNAAIAIIAISLSPSFVLWSLQPLKDAFFQLLVVAFVCACAAWQNLWTGPPRWQAVVARGALLVFVLAALSGVRWYVAFAILIATTPFLFAIALRAPARKGLALIAAVGVALLLSRALLVGGRGHVPQPIVALLTPATTLATISDLPALLGTEIAATRDAFNRTGGRTIIQPRSQRPPALEPASATTGDAAIRDVVTQIIAGWNRGDAEAILANFDDTPEVELWNNGKRVARGPGEVRDVYGALAASSEGEEVTIAGVQVVIEGAAATASGQWRRESRRQPVEGSVTFVLRQRGDRWRVVRQTVGAPSPARVSVSSGSPARAGASSATHAPRRGPLARLATGLAAMLMPRMIGEALGLFHIGGGRGFLWLTDVDTIAFDVALLFSIVIIARRFRAAGRDPVVWMLIAFTLLIAVPLAYAVTNFGTLFRLREAIYLGVILAPAAAVAAAGRRVPEDP